MSINSNQAPGLTDTFENTVMSQLSGYQSIWRVYDLPRKMEIFSHMVTRDCNAVCKSYMLTHQPKTFTAFVLYTWALKLSVGRDTQCMYSVCWYIHIFVCSKLLQYLSRTAMVLAWPPWMLASDQWPQKGFMCPQVGEFVTNHRTI